MKLKMVHCPGSGRDNPHSFAVQGDARGRCSRCLDVAYTDTVDGMVLSYNVDAKLVDRKPVRTEPLKAGPSTEVNLGYTVYSGFGLK